MDAVSQVVVVDAVSQVVVVDAASHVVAVDAASHVPTTRFPKMNNVEAALKQPLDESSLAIVKIRFCYRD